MRASSTASETCHGEKGGVAARNKDPLDEFVIERVVL
jgi:hypothetical protein